MAFCTYKDKMKLFGTLFLSVFVLASCQKQDFFYSDGRGERFSNLSDQVLFINIWADWCPPCIKEFPYFNQINEKKDESVIGDHFDQFDSLSDSEVNKLIEKFGVTFPNLRDDPRDIWGIDLPENVPTTYIIKNNKVIETITTPLTLEDLENKLASYSTFD